jgi:effector-binding domain-containing protein
MCPCATGSGGRAAHGRARTAGRERLWRPSAVPGNDEVLNGTLPGGRYASLTHTGHPDELEAATARLLSWAAERELRWDIAETDAGEAWGCRLEFYKTDPAAEPDMSRWETELAFRLAD